MTAGSDAIDTDHRATKRKSLRDAAAVADSERFVERDAELSVARAVLDDGTPSRVLFLHGPGGIGKSAMLRAIARLAAGSGFAVATIDPRALPDEFDRRLADALAAPVARTLLVLDEVDVLGSRLDAVRDRLLAGMPNTSRLVLAGRQAPDPSWRADGLDTIFVDLSLRTLTDASSARLLQARGVEAARVPEIVAWAQGSPLALTVAATVPATEPDGLPAAKALEARLTSWLAGRPMLDVPADVLEVAALAPVVDARLLAAALPGGRTREAMRELVALPVVERIGDRAMLHVVLASAIRARLAHSAPARMRTLTRRIVEHLAARARLGDIHALVEMSQFVSDPAMRQAISNQPSASMFTDRPTAGEFVTFAHAQGFDRGEDWPELLRWAEQGQDYTLVTRRRDGTVVLFGAFARAVDLPELGPITTSLRAATAATGTDPVRTIAGIVLFADASYHDRVEAARLGTGALMHQHGIADMQAVLIHYPEPDRRPTDALSAIAHQLPGDLLRPVALSDFRPDGAVGFVELVVLGELGFPAHGAASRALLADGEDPDREAMLRARLDVVFGDTPDEQRLRRTIELAHLGPRRSEQDCLEDLHVSRRTWYRLLRKARERVLGPDRSAPASTPGAQAAHS